MSNLLRPRRSGLRLRELSLAAMLVAASGCGGIHTLEPLQLVPAAPGLAPIAWLSPTHEPDAAALRRWRAAVGSPLVVRTQSAEVREADALTVVTWNVALDGGDVIGFVRELQSRVPGRPVVLLLQEAFRGGDDVPAASARPGGSHLGSCDATREIDHVARELGFSLYYIPSMRNGLHREDRGNAVLSSIPLDDLSAIELPFERQRRVAQAVRVSGRTTAGSPWSLRLVNVHLDNRVSARYAWIATEYGRARQARGLIEALEGPAPTILAGDFNTLFGFSDLVYTQTARAFPQTHITDSRRTFRGLLRLDHVFYRLSRGWSASTRRGESSFGSDHHPLITTVTFQAGG